jgi:hypothetical protein
VATEAGPADGGSLAHRAAHSTTLRTVARLGLVGYALLHLVVAWLALQLAWWAGRPRPVDRGAAVDRSGAMALLADSPLGPLLLWLLTAGLAGLCLWQAVEVLRHHRRLPAPAAEPHGAWALVVVAVGLAAFSVYCLARARHPVG